MRTRYALNISQPALILTGLLFILAGFCLDEIAYLYDWTSIVLFSLVAAVGFLSGIVWAKT